ncbi:tetratricopeptide repeat protein [Cellvibrio japonicus]|uniref:Putative adenylate cyclase n=1 Tax=Cellvibrio japonicus (strain Ueda107) TaxID=498211 RepID=B3PG65_CELJU|nr:tetratricopeptide repeat protein [Cellvibrio japonicus]ACE82702.1 putative adenylate cyclase [Cellvibrio japonicus Ueda107]QEI13740.1 tetratricopeptide repeat protein [Cellvibrio japonicus]QEI17314.1 tetratricopeptide repeat protein [Cellvibrio japonicus]QEI20891.1 tetratricopeptide repeat protein [Cellvibrio japonicus]
MVADHTQHCEQTLMFTDIVGYSRLMGCNESLAVDMLGDYRRILLAHIQAQGGVLVEFVGDAIFARFNSAAAAVAAAIAIQQELLVFNEARDKKLPRLQTRIGLHKGEVMLRGGAVFGDSVNIAARLEPLAVPDGICISHSVYEDIRLSLSSPAKRLGTPSLKNIEQRVRVYFIKPAGIGWRDHLHYFLRGLNENIFAYRYPLVAMLFALIAAGIYFIPRWLVPGYSANYVEIADFQNLMDKKGEADYFSAGITEAVRSQLADLRDVYIVDAKEGIHAPLRLEGSVQRLGDNIRISYRLLRRKGNVQIVGGKLDGTYQDIFILQDRLVGEIARFLADEFSLQNFRPAPLKLTNDVTAYDFYMQGVDYLNASITHASIDEAVKRFSTALVHDSHFPLAMRGLCESYWRKYELVGDWVWLDFAEKHCIEALSLDDQLVDAYMSLAAIYRDTGRHQQAIDYLENGLSIKKDNISVMLVLASVYSDMNDIGNAEKIYVLSIQKDPKNWKAYEHYAYFLTGRGRYDEAIKLYEKIIDFVPDNSFALNNIAINYFYKMDFKRAAAFFEKASNIDPSGYSYANTGNMYYTLGAFDKAAEMYSEALQLEPDNYQYLAYLGDAYKHISGKNKQASECFERVIKYAAVDRQNNPRSARSYYYLARAYTYFGNLAKANELMDIADGLEPNSTEANYTHLRIALTELDDERIKMYATKLLDAEYSYELLLADPDLSLLKEEKFRDIFFNH